MKIYFVTFHSVEVASQRFRAHWVAPYLPGAEVVTLAHIPTDGDVYIWCKFGIPDAIERLPDAKHYWDVCDPFWWFKPDDARHLIGMVDGMVASSDALCDDLAEFSGKNCHCIPDRMELSHYPIKAEHGPRETVRFVWYGHSANRVAIFNGLVNLERLAANGHQIDLTIIDDQPDNPFLISEMFPIHHLRWDLAEENATLAQFDIAYLPKYPGPWGRVKSSNKVFTAWACGLPVTEAQEYNELAELVTDADWRAALALEGESWLQKDGLVQKSAEAWRDLLSLS